MASSPSSSSSSSFPPRLSPLFLSGLLSLVTFHQSSLSAEACWRLFVAIPLVVSPPLLFFCFPLHHCLPVTPVFSLRLCPSAKFFTSNALRPAPRCGPPLSPPECRITELKMNERLGSVKRMMSQLNVPLRNAPLCCGVLVGLPSSTRPTTVAWTLVYIGTN